MNQPITKSIKKNIAVFSHPVMRLGVVALLAIGSASCGGDGDGAGGGGGITNFTEHDQLIANAANIMNASAIQLAASTAALQTSINAYCADASSIADPANRTAAQDAFKVAMNDVQHSVMHADVGPNKDALAGIRIAYSWPLTSSCRVDIRLTDGLATAQPVLPPGNPINRRGLDALEYLLFVAPASAHTCDIPTTDLTAFNALSTADKQLRRCGYMTQVIADVVTTSSGLKTAWAAHVPVMTAGTEEAGDVLNEVTDAVYYLADIGKEDKLDQPMGRGVTVDGSGTQTTPSCGLGVACPVDVESPNAKISFDNLRANTVAFQTVFFGGDVADKATNVGFDDWMAAEDGNRTAADKIGADIVTLLGELDALKTDCGSLYNAVENCSMQLATFFDGSFQDVTRGLRDTMLETLGLQRPQAALADVD